MQHKGRVKTFCVWLRWMSEISDLIPLRSSCSASLALVCIKQKLPQVLQLTFITEGQAHLSVLISVCSQIIYSLLLLLKVQWNKSLVPAAEAVSGHRCSQCLSTVIPTGLCFLHPMLRLACPLYVTHYFMGEEGTTCNVMEHNPTSYRTHRRTPICCLSAARIAPFTTGGMLQG